LNKINFFTKYMKVSTYARNLGVVKMLRLENIKSKTMLGRLGEQGEIAKEEVLNNIIKQYETKKEQ
jgi:hypothetical protein